LVYFTQNSLATYQQVRLKMKYLLSFIASFMLLVNTIHCNTTTTVYSDEECTLLVGKLSQPTQFVIIIIATMLPSNKTQRSQFFK
jgi:hypothetical protein